MQRVVLAHQTFKKRDTSPKNPKPQASSSKPYAYTLAPKSELLTQKPLLDRYSLHI